MILQIAYFPPVEYFAVLAKYSAVYLDCFEHYQKQSYRNRCRILTANGPMDLRFPIVHNGKRDITKVEVDYATPWVRQTEYAIESAYCSSPFFDYYKDELFAVLDSHPRTLWELDSELISFFCRKIGIIEPLPLSEEDARKAGASGQGVMDIHPKHPSDFVGKPYWQVFGDKFGFVGNLSVMDLLFNEGTESLFYLR